jgi:prophage maintenance system killer protein
LRDRHALEAAAATTSPAALVRVLVEGRPFVDANRRTALLAGAYAHLLLGRVCTPEEVLATGVSSLASTTGEGTLDAPPEPHDC